MISPLQGVTPRSFPPLPALSCLDLGASLHEAFHPLSKLFFSLHPGVKDLLLLFAGERVPRLDLRMQLNLQLPRDSQAALGTADKAELVNCDLSLS